MILVLEKAFDILELLAGEAPAAVGLGAIAERLGLNPGTAANILKTLLARGAVHQAGPRKGYCLGPILPYLARKAGRGRDIASAAEPVLARLAQRCRESVVVAMIQGGRRYSLCQVDGAQELQVRSEHVSDDIFRTATGRLLTAYLPPADLAALVRQQPPSAADWPELEKLSALPHGLERIARDGWVLIHRQDVVAAAFRIQDGPAVVAALGVALPRIRFRGPHRQEVLSATRAAADEITRILSKKTHKSD